MRACGLVSWERRIVRRPWPAGGKGASRAEQTSNAYALSMPQQAPALSLCKKSFASSLTVAVAPAFDPAARKALERIAAARAARLAQAWGARRDSVAP